MKKLLPIVCLLALTLLIPISVKASDAKVAYMVVEDQAIVYTDEEPSPLWFLGLPDRVRGSWYYKTLVDDLGGSRSARNVGISKATWGIQEEFTKPRYYVPVILDSDVCQELRSLKAPLFWNEQNQRVPTAKLYLPDHTQQALLAVDHNGPIYHANETAPDEVRQGVSRRLRWDAEARLFFVRGSMAYDYNKFVAKECR